MGPAASAAQMQRHRFLACLVAALAFAGPARAAAQPTVLVKFADPARAAAAATTLGDDPVGQTANHVAVVRPGGGETVAEAVADYRRRRDVLFAEPNGAVHAASLPNPDDPFFAPDPGAGFPGQWALEATGTLAATKKSGPQEPCAYGEWATNNGRRHR